MSEERWYSERRARWKPEKVRLLLIAESAPDDGGDEANRRFFYDDALTRHDGLFREVTKALYVPGSLESGPGAKRPWLQRLKDDGVFLIDLAAAPVNYHSQADRNAALKENVDATVSGAVALRPDGIVLVKRNVFDHLYEPLREAGLNVLHDEFIPFPGSGQQARFRERITEALRHLG